MTKVTRLLAAACAAAALACCGPGGAGAQELNLDQALGSSQRQAEQPPVPVACGAHGKSNCSVLPRIAYYAALQGVQLVEQNSKGSLQSALAVCRGIVPAAIGQFDSFSAVAEQTQCVGRLDLVGGPIYPYYGFLVVRASNPAGSLQGLVDRAQAAGRTLVVSDGSPGDGGRTTFEAILSSSQQYRDVVSEVAGGPDLSLGELQDGQIDAYFFMDGPGSAVVQAIRAAADPGTRRPLYKIVAVNPPDSFFALENWRGGPMYARARLGGWGPWSDSTVTTNAVMVVNDGWYSGLQGSPTAVDVLRQALGSAAAAIRADTKTPAGWAGRLGGG